MACSSSSSSKMPVWIDDDYLDGEWLCHKIPSLRRHVLVAASSPPSSSSSPTCDESSSSMRRRNNPAIQARDISNMGRRGAVVRDGGTIRLTVVSAADEVPVISGERKDQQQNDPPADTIVEFLVLKQIPAHRAELSRALGLEREAFFYQELAPQLLSPHRGSSSNRILPRVDYAYGNMETGEKCIIMENLGAPWVDSGIFFGPGNPNNWNRDLPALLKDAASAAANREHTIPLPTATSVAQATFQAMAQIHATFWNQETLLAERNHWLRGHAWIQGRDQESWQASQTVIQTIWNTYTNNNETRELSSDDDTIKEKTGTTLQWNTTVRQAVENAVEGISWEAQLDRLHSGRGKHWTLVHGDFWPGNVMWNVANGQLRLLDWEMVGLGSGPQDLGQYILSNMDPAERRACERDLLRSYYQELICCGVAEDESNSLWDYVWREYRIGGVERWLWFLIYFVGQPDMIGWAQFFHDQIASFMEDHGLKPSDITQPRP